ncbi:MAG: hypothetical protein JXR68_07810 [Bacteroidales bacterium]|nr:hypothetical protein [Bacteroidales bacterium]
MIKLTFKNREYTLSGYNAEASVDDGMIYINGNQNYYHFALNCWAIRQKHSQRMTKMLLFL